MDPQTQLLFFWPLVYTEKNIWIFITKYMISINIHHDYDCTIGKIFIIVNYHSIITLLVNWSMFISCASVGLIRLQIEEWTTIEFCFSCILKIWDACQMEVFRNIYKKTCSISFSISLAFRTAWHSNTSFRLFCFSPTIFTHTLTILSSTFLFLTLKPAYQHKNPKIRTDWIKQQEKIS